MKAARRYECGKHERTVLAAHETPASYALAISVQGELDRVSQTLTGRIKQLAERYAEPLPQLVTDVAALSAKVEAHLNKMGFKP